MSFLDHPSLPKLKPKSPYSKIKLKSPEKDAKEKYKRFWREGNEERMLRALERFGSLQLRVKFEIIEENQEKVVGYRTLSGKTLVFKKIPSQGCLLGIVEGLTEAGVGEVEKWRLKLLMAGKSITEANR